VLVLTDLSKESVAAAKVAAAVAPAAQVHFFHVLSLREEEEMRMVGIAPAVIRRQRRVMMAQAHIRMHELVSHLEGASRFVYAFGHGSLIPVVLRKIEAIAADLLVLVRKPRSGLRAIWRPGTAQRLVDRCSCHVLAVYRDPARELAAASTFARESLAAGLRGRDPRSLGLARDEDMAATMSQDP
jgi:nucleotide-binding universal stress UspA family protein